MRSYVLTEKGHRLLRFMDEEFGKVGYRELLAPGYEDLLLEIASGQFSQEPYAISPIDEGKLGNLEHLGLVSRPRE